MKHWTENYVGIPFKTRGRDTDGVDCWGLICLIYLEMFGIELPSLDDCYNDTRETEKIKRIAIAQANSDQGWNSVLKGQEDFGDVLLMPMVGIRSHVAMVIEAGYMIHVTEGIDVTVEEYYSALWRPRYERSLIYRHPKVIT